VGYLTRGVDVVAFDVHADLTMGQHQDMRF
jgi:hypothetical protein